jgi:shikimate kinase
MKRVILVGFMGCGKSSLGKRLANRLNIPFLDSDEEIEKISQKSIGEIFGTQGESRFREIEKDYILSIEPNKEFVLATGGGLPCYEKNMHRLNELGVTFYLERSPKELAHRLLNAKSKRPLVDGFSNSELLSYIEDKLSEREEYYKQATLVLSQEEQTVAAIEKFIFLLDPDSSPLQKS